MGKMNDLYIATRLTETTKPQAPQPPKESK